MMQDNNVNGQRQIKKINLHVIPCYPCRFNIFQTRHPDGLDRHAPDQD